MKPRRCWSTSPRTSPPRARSCWRRTAPTTSWCTEMGSPAKFLFDVDFSNPSGRGDAATAADVARKIAEAEARAHRDGVAAGLAQANAESARRNAIALEQIAATMGA